MRSAIRAFGTRTPERKNKNESSNQNTRRSCLAAVFPCLTFAQYTRTDLVTNSGAGGTVNDFHLVNGWGSVSPATSPWVSDNSTGFSTLYSISNTGGVVVATPASLVVSVPSVSGGAGLQLDRRSGNSRESPPLPFPALIRSPESKLPRIRSLFFAGSTARSADGIRGRRNHRDRRQRRNITPADRSSVGATYTGLAIANNGGPTFLYAPMTDQTPDRRVRRHFKLANEQLSPNAFVDPRFRRVAPYGIQTITAADARKPSGSPTPPR